MVLYKGEVCYYLLQGGYVLPVFCLSVCLLATARKNYSSDLHENFMRDVSLDKEDAIKLWNSSASGSGYRNVLKDSSLSSTLQDRAV